jgi:polyisoprenoid-binding protein YceI
MNRSAIFVVIVAFVATVPAYPRAADNAGPGFEVMNGSITVVCPLTVGGNFEAKTEAIDGNLTLNPDRPGAVDGAIVVDLNTLKTGIELRDEHMREKYLEVQRGPEYSQAKIDNIRLEGFDPARPAGKVKFTGVLTLHGMTRDLSGAANIKQAGKNINVEASFPLKVSDFDIPSPTYLGVGVRNQISVAVNFHAQPKAS